MKSKIPLLGILVIFILLFIGGCRNAGKWLVKDDCQPDADAIVILMGSISDRTLQAFDLYQKNVADKIIIVEAGMGAYKALEERGVYIISNTTQVQNALISLGVPPDKIIILQGDATSTKMEAMIVLEYLKSNNSIHTVTLVTSPDHTRRASMIFGAAYKNKSPQVSFYSCPSTYAHFDPDRWWKSRDGIETVLLEYLKIGSYLLFEKRKLK
jgi:uncharacterized SAM-binding protein YcdF (DUF218 family)